MTRPFTTFLLPLLLIFLWGGDKMFNGLSGYSWSNVACSVVVIGLAVLFLTRTLFTSFSSIFQNPVYLFGAALLIHFGAAAVIEGLLLIARPTGAGAAETLFYLGIAVNILVNLIYLKTILCISKAARFSYA